LRIELLSEEAMRTSAIEGEVLDRSSVQSSLRCQFGLTADGAPPRPREQGVAEMMVDAYTTYAAPLAQDTLCRWHGMLLSHVLSAGTLDQQSQRKTARRPTANAYGRCDGACVAPNEPGWLR
jgi:Fic family protein